MQTGFVLGAAALVWLLLVAYMRRREQGQRLVRMMGLLPATMPVRIVNLHE